MPRQPCTKTSPRARKGGAPRESATCWTVGSRKKGTDGRMYEVRKLSKSQRWVPAKGSAKKKARSPAAPAAATQKSAARKSPAPKRRSSAKKSSRPASAKRKKSAASPDKKRGVRKAKHSAKTPNDYYADLEAFWGLLAQGRGAVLVYADKSHEIQVTPHKTRPATDRWYRKLVQQADDDDDVVAVLSSARSYDSYEALAKKAKGKGVEHVIRNYKKFFESLGGKDYVM